MAADDKLTDVSLFSLRYILGYLGGCLKAIACVSPPFGISEHELASTMTNMNPDLTHSNKLKGSPTSFALYFMDMQFPISMILHCLEMSQNRLCVLGLAVLGLPRSSTSHECQGRPFHQASVCVRSQLPGGGKAGVSLDLPA